MWIRSQDKTRLIDAYYIRVNGKVIEAIHSNMLCTEIGEYSSQEKALKVIDMIQTSIIGKRTETSYDFKEFIHTTHNYFSSIENLVFQMPLDIEVEEEE